MFAHPNEQAHIGFAKTVDGLHGVAHQKQGFVALRFPAGGEALDETNLRRAGVLEFVDQQVADGVVELQLQIGGGEFVAQGFEGLLRHLDKVHLAGGLKLQPQLRAGHFQQVDEVLQQLLLGRGVGGLGQAQRAFEQGAVTRVFELFKQGLDELEGVFGFGGADAQISRGCGAQVAAAGEQQRG